MVIILIFYLLSLLFIFLYSITQGYLAYIYTRIRKKRDIPTLDNYPTVTIQLPVYNELYVVRRLIDSVVAIDYPRQKLQIQILDDSTDETTELINEVVSYWKNAGINIKRVSRIKRQGYKAGALKHGLEEASGDFIAIFDADFTPGKDFLLKTIPHFQNEGVGVVQTRWEHQNRDYSVLTRLQAFGLDAHFRVEQTGRNNAGCFINFNGTAGVWRKKCILDAGNWHDDTLTEDLDLSYRAQMKGWKFIYLEDVTSPAELPPVMSALKSQQYRWNKGGAETAKKHLVHLIKSDLPLKVKWQGAFHLLNSAIFLAILFSATLSIPLLHFKSLFPEMRDLYSWLSIFLLSFIVIGWIYYLVSKKNTLSSSQAVLYYFKHFPLFLSISMGLSLHNALAVAEGYMGKKTSFIRTPKFNLTSSNSVVGTNKYLQTNIPILTYFEGLMATYFSYGIFFAFQRNEYSMLPFHTMLTIGFSLVCYYSVSSARIRNKPSVI